MKTAAAVGLKRMNRGNIYKLIYSNRRVTKKSIADELNLSLPTVTQNLNELARMGLIEKDGHFESSGGRKPQSINCIHRSRIALGVDIQKEQIDISAIDLYGDILQHDVICIRFENNVSYYQKLGEFVNRFIEGLNFSTKRILGVGIALQARLSPDNQSVFYGEILGCAGLRLVDLAAFIPYPCKMIHDSEAGAFAEMWFSGVASSGIYLSLGRNIGSAIINFEQHKKSDMISCTAEHMVIVPEGRLCYCGKTGCVETYCSANALLADEQGNLDEFFKLLRQGRERQKKKWLEYLDYLAKAIENLHMVIERDVILGGLVANYLQEDDLAIVDTLLNKHASFYSRKPKVRIGHRLMDVVSIGAALLYVTEFLSTI
jgi:predicted NBD/HSP70 family sugar kinase